METLSDIGTISAIMAGISLSAASGLRVFIPILALGLAGRFGVLEVSEQFVWLTSEPVLIVVGLAALFEAGAYYVPFGRQRARPVGHAGCHGWRHRDRLFPAAGDERCYPSGPPPRWSGGGSAGIVQIATVLTRGLSTANQWRLDQSAGRNWRNRCSLLAVMLASARPDIFRHRLSSSHWFALIVLGYSSTTAAAPTERPDSATRQPDGSIDQQ